MLLLRRPVLRYVKAQRRANSGTAAPPSLIVGDLLSHRLCQTSLRRPRRRRNRIPGVRDISLDWSIRRTRRSRARSDTRVSGRVEVSEVSQAGFWNLLTFVVI
jgi:hypothetical protein